MSFHTVIIKACKIEVSLLLSLMFLTKAFATYTICERILCTSEHLNYTTESLAIFIIVNNLQNVSTIHQRNLFHKWSFYDTIENNTGTMKHSNLKHSCYAHCNSNVCNLQKFSLDVKVHNTPIFSTRREPAMEAVTHVQHHKCVETSLPMLPLTRWTAERGILLKSHFTHAEQSSREEQQRGNQKLNILGEVERTSDLQLLYIILETVALLT